MKSPAKIVVILSLLSNLLFAQELIFCVSPTKSNKALYKEHEPLLKHLEKTLNQKVKLTIAKDYNNQIELLLSKKIHIALLGPYNYTKAKKADGKIEYIATQQYKKADEMVSSYQAVIVTSKQSGIKTLQELKGKRFGFTDFNSTSGYLFPNLILKEQGISKKDFSEYFMLKKHTHIMEALTRDSIDAGATHYGNYLNFVKKYGDKYLILHTSETIPYDAIVVNSTVPKNLKMKIQQAFLSYTQKLNGQNIPGYIKRNVSDYDVIKKSVEKLQ